jgi:hypothetical protein
LFNLPRFLGTSAVIGGIVAVMMAYNTHAARGTDLKESPTVVNHVGADVNDVYLFPAPDNPKNVVLVMDVNPAIPRGMGTATYFDPTVMYQFKIVHTASPGPTTAAEDMVIQFAANGSSAGQTIVLYGPGKPNSTGTLSTFLVPVGSVPYNTSGTVGSSGIKLFAGPRSDPSFFDLNTFFAILPDRNYQNHLPGAQFSLNGPTSFNGFQTGNAGGCSSTAASDYFSSQGLDTLAIVLELPKTVLAPNPAQQIVHVWATTSTASGS